MASFDPYSRYLDVQFGTTDQGGLIMMVYDGAIRFCRSAEQCLEKGDKIGKGMWLAKAFDTVAELRNSLRPELGGEVARELDKAYAFVGRQITLANVLGRPEYIRNAIVMLERMQDAWREVIKEQRQSPSPAPQQARSR